MVCAFANAIGCFTIEVIAAVTAYQHFSHHYALLWLTFQILR
ncbi:hypothetical protein [Bartonella sp. AR 15-3]|nr:hypothetical protein [Bartonella sp. AR 15-3]